MAFVFPIYNPESITNFFRLPISTLRFGLLICGALKRSGSAAIEIRDESPHSKA
jgi:hypothetical protein